MKELSPSAKAWIGLGVYVAGYDVLAPKGETLSEGVDRALEKRFTRALAIGGTALVASHLLNLIPEKVDPIHYALKWKHYADSVVE